MALTLTYTLAPAQESALTEACERANIAHAHTSAPVTPEQYLMARLEDVLASFVAQSELREFDAMRELMRDPDAKKAVRKALKLD